ncbi:PhzF family phenazine biosynthesis protein [Marivirga sp. S37H4]|uniref:PhzF family phenazine biosynthesis protein n=1 Tax=Marivirga aurantiaca TaxID=2802615 RepID=A0A934WX60_9BACT|nr:PhzF family phenazine biosynthesis protein [Marivirga aurantiaca]MBK6264561.1 PhzF family phenazine biosynthesis protein [Marivirga aurantiaca]
MQQKATYYLLDVFTNQPFGGNPLAVFPNADGFTGEQMQKLTKELNLSESVFLLKPTHPDADLRMRIYTPGMELPTAGHPTIGTAFLLLEEKLIVPKKTNQITLEQSIGNIQVNFQKDHDSFVNIMMQQPLPKFEQTFKDKKLVASLLSIEENEIEREFPCRIVNCGNPFLIIPVRQLRTMERLKLNHDLFYQILDEIKITGIMAFSLETTSADTLTHSRMFAPHLGMIEDPATGSAHGPLAAYLFNYQMAEMKQLVIGEQGIEMGRPARINMQIEQEGGKISKVLIGGESVIMGKGEIRI